MKTICILIAFSALAVHSPAQAGVITYGAGFRPVEFPLVEVNEMRYRVEVTWDSTYTGVYGPADNSSDPFFWGDPQGAGDAAHALKQLLLDDGYTQSTVTSYLMVPHGWTRWTNSHGVWLHTPTLSIKNVAAYRDTYYGTTGYTQWTPLGPVPEPASLAFLAIGFLAATQRRR